LVDHEGSLTMSRNMTLLATLFIITNRFGKALRARMLGK